MSHDESEDSPGSTPGKNLEMSKRIETDKLNNHMILYTVNCSDNFRTRLAKTRQKQKNKRTKPDRAKGRTRHDDTRKFR
ncbi:MAG: hypothetical protein JSW34_06985 [Candidatus Zixiibacteriota bacterium]|nr:MAG: hypothetical protein JSW34_06985 [candidate division Zixibacteria bacterium]